LNKRVKKFFLSFGISAFICANSGFAFAEEDLKNYLLEPMPGWFTEGFTRGHLDINYLTKKKGYSFRDALEIQNIWKDLLDQDPEYMKLEKAGKTYEMVKTKHPLLLDTLKKAIDKFNSEKKYESGFVPEKLGKQDFYVVFDLDETLLVQWYENGALGKDYFDSETDISDTILRPAFYSPKYFSMTPGWEKMFKEIVNIPGNKGIILFTAKEDKSSLDVLNKIKIEGKPLKTFVKGFFTRNYLSRDKAPTKLSKDLRLIDETLEHVIIIDDNPTRIFEKQLANLREFPKYNADAYLTAKNKTKDPVILNYFEKLFPMVLEEIKDSAEYARKNDLTFAEAYYPYSMEGSAELLMLIRQGYSLSDAVTFLRKNKNLTEPKFFYFEEKK